MLLLIPFGCLTVDSFPDRYNDSACEWEKRCAVFKTASEEAAWTCSRDYYASVLAFDGSGTGVPPCAVMDDLNAAACLDNFGSAGCDSYEPVTNANCLAWCDEYE